MKFELTFVSLLLSATGFSQNISTEAPSVSASAVTVPQGFLQGELSAGFDIDKDGAGTIIQSAEAPYLLLRYGWKKRLELRMQNRTGLSRVNTALQYRYREFSLGAKYAILPNEGRTNLAVIVDVSPFGGTWRSQRGSATLAFSQAIGENSTLGANAGYSIYATNLFDDNGSIINQSILGSGVYSYSFLDRFTAFGEFFYSFTHTDFDAGTLVLKNDAYGIDFGLQFLLRKNIQLDWVSGFSLTSKDQFHSLGFNIYLDTRKKK